MPNAAGLVHRAEIRAETDAPAVARLRATGAIPIGVTNTSEATMWIESSNHLYGRTNNAYNPKRTAGGSSGGEGASIGAGFAPIGLGTDIGGSIRLPAFFNGVFGHKPSPGLVPNTGQFPSTEGEAAYMLTLGPLTRHAEDLMPVTRIIAGPDGIDEYCVPRELKDPAATDLSALRVLVVDDASLIPARKELREARDRAADALHQLGARTERVSLKQLRRALEIYLAALGDGASVSLSELLTDAGVDLQGRRHWVDAARGRGDHTLPVLITAALERLNRHMPDTRIRKAVEAARALREEMQGILGDDGILLHPPHPRVAPRHGGTVGRAWVLTPAAVFNLLGLPVTEVPLGLNPKGLPLGVQVAAADGNDHLTIAAALALERRFGGWVPPA
jgi:fatty acid amide hydrolase 2